MEKAEKNSISSEISTESEVSAPVTKGQILGTLKLRSGVTVLKEIPLISGEDIPRLTFGELFLKILKRAAMAKG